MNLKRSYSFLNLSKKNHTRDLIRSKSFDSFNLSSNIQDAFLLQVSKLEGVKYNFVILQDGKKQGVRCSVMDYARGFIQVECYGAKQCLSVNPSFLDLDWEYFKEQTKAFIFNNVLKHNDIILQSFERNVTTKPSFGSVYDYLNLHVLSCFNLGFGLTNRCEEFVDFFPKQILSILNQKFGMELKKKYIFKSDLNGDLEQFSLYYPSIASTVSNIKHHVVFCLESEKDKLIFCPLTQTRHHVGESFTTYIRRVSGSQDVILFYCEDFSYDFF